MRVAIADDQEDVVTFLSEIVESLGHIVVKFKDGVALTQSLRRDVFDLIILDWTMPGMTGMDVLNWMKETLDERPPVIMLTNRSAKQDIAAALNAGADDFIIKPEDRGVISARVNAMLRRNVPSGSFDAEAKYGKYTLNRIEQHISFDNEQVTLTAKEFELADILFRNSDRTLSRSYLMETIWRTNAALSTRTLDMHVSRIRSKLQLGPENGFRIFTVFGYGYRLETLS
ncbi:DNA-binding response regulator [Sphingorhabdus lutea]|uniref:DNA-binding response regulator n=1 Tax=Sphingorhabdus lutea TaxID=1913578 RepID=A0A1L3JAT6_9SPHN|nr:response regulator transcription factor [Sphingorhabdus lutea]APG62236.1 DNA-binding response regulator [Sphingorhabdus lutea]